MTSKGPIPPEHREIARGAGAAALLMFLHIAVTGYLGFLIYYLVKHGQQAIWNFAQMQAAVYYWIPAFFAVFTMLPTDKLSHTVALVARVIGFIALGSLNVAVMKALSGADAGGGAWMMVLAAEVFGIGVAVIIRYTFAGLMGAARGNYKKSEPENEVSE